MARRAQHRRRCWFGWLVAALRPHRGDVEPSPSAEVREAREHANRQLEKANQTVDSLESVARRNHFGEAMLQLFRGVINGDGPGPTGAAGAGSSTHRA